MDYLYAFLGGGALCAIAQILIDKTKLTPARIMVLYVSGGAALGALGLYEPLTKLLGAGATVPLTGFGYSLSKGAISGAAESGFLGALAGGLKATSTGIAAAIISGFIVAMLFKPKPKEV